MTRPAAAQSVGVALACLLAACATAEAPVDLAVVGVTVVDVEAGTTTPGRTLLIRGDRIVADQPADATVPAAAGTVDGAGLFAIPGLWDMHVHALWDAEMAPWLLEEFVRHGVTGIRDMGGDLEVLRTVREAPAAQRRPWPRIVAAGKVLDGPEPVDPSLSIGAGDAPQAVAAVDALAAAGADFVKVYTLLPRDAFFAATERAGELGLPVTGHLPAAVSVAEAVAAGLIGVEHLRDEIEPLCHGLDETACSALIDEFRERGVYNTPTLTVLEAKGFRGYRPPGAQDLPVDLPDALADFWARSAAARADRPEEYFMAKQARFAGELELVDRLARAGAPLLAGSDTGNPFIAPGSSLHHELELLVRAGLTPAAALFAATIAPARFLDHDDDAGGLQPGAEADVVLLRANPLDDIANVRAIAGVILRGRSVPIPGGSP